MGRLRIFILLIPLLVVLSSNQGDFAVSEKEGHGEEDFPFPTIPAVIKNPEERAAFLLTHYWDHVDFGRHVLSDRDALMEQGFVDFLSVFPYADTLVLQEAFSNMLEKALTDVSRVGPLLKLGETYLYHPNSPMLNETYFQWFVESFLKVRELPSTERERLRFHQMALKRNKVGTKVENFSFTDIEEHSLELYDLKAPRILLFFYDAECDECKQVLSQMQESADLRDLVHRKQLVVVTVCVEGSVLQWKEMSRRLPNTWIKGRVSDFAALLEKFVFRAMPTIYVLDENRQVIQKDISWDRLQSLRFGFR